SSDLTVCPSLRNASSSLMIRRSVPMLILPIIVHRYRAAHVHINITMKIDNKFKVYIKCPKTGSTSFTKFMRHHTVYFDRGRRYDGNKIIIANSVTELKDSDILDDAFIFTTVRNPYDRIISAWKHWFSKEKLF